MQKTNRTILIIALIALVNMLGYGIIIPILYSYSKKYGLTDFENGLLFALFSICQFFATPIIGRLSDKYGRRPLLIISILGTAVSFFMMAFAPGPIFLFLSRALDGLTAGNIPVAFAVISDSTKPEERAKAFGYISSAFNFGFVFGPAIAALTVGLAPSIPFIIAGVITLAATALTIFYLPETNTHMGEVKGGKLFDFKHLWHSLFNADLGKMFVMSLVFFMAFACALIYGFQPFVINVLGLTTTQNAYLFTLFGTVGLISQTFFVARISQRLGLKKAFSYGMVFTIVSFLLMFISRTWWVFLIPCIVLAIANSLVQTLFPTILSQEADAKSQGSIMGLNSSYQSIGMIIGPFIGGAAATLAVTAPFLVGALLVLPCYWLSRQVMSPNVKPESAF
jgi:MFS family permease